MYHMVHAILDSICENVLVWETENMTDRERSELHVQQGEIRFCRVLAKCWLERENDTLEPQYDSAGDISNEVQFHY